MYYDEYRELKEELQGQKVTDIRFFQTKSRNYFDQGNAVVIFFGNGRLLIAQENDSSAFQLADTDDLAMYEQNVAEGEWEEKI